MAMIKSVTIKNDRVKEAIAAKDEAVRVALVKIGLLAERYAKEALTEQKAVDTGRLRNSVSNQHDENTVYVGTNVEYAPYIEFGARSMPPRPYLKPAIADHVDEYEKILENSLKQ